MWIRNTYLSDLWDWFLKLKVIKRFSTLKHSAGSWRPTKAPVRWDYWGARFPIKGATASWCVEFKPTSLYYLYLVWPSYQMLNNSDCLIWTKVQNKQILQTDNTSPSSHDFRGTPDWLRTHKASTNSGSESSPRSVAQRDTEIQPARSSLQVQSCIVGNLPVTLLGTERHLLPHSHSPRKLLIGTFQECGMEFCSLLSYENESQTLWMETS